MTTWISTDEWTGSDPTAAQLDAVRQWQRRHDDYQRLKQRGLRVRPPRHPYFRAGLEPERVKLRSATHVRQLGEILGVR